MPKRMLIDATHPEETRVVVINGTRLEEFDFESSTKRQVKGNIYLAKVTRVEPSLQAAFVEYGGNRHGFLAFSEIHPDYYRIPVGDRPHGAAEPPDGNGDRTRDNGAGNGEDAGVPLAAALPEPVQVPQSEAEDDLPGDEPRNEPIEEPAPVDPADDVPSREGARGAVPSWAVSCDDGLREDAPAETQGEDRDGGDDNAVTAETVSPSEAAAFAADPPPVEGAIPTEPEGAACADAAAISGPEPSQAPAEEPVATDRERGGEAWTVDREPATIGLRAAEDSLVTAEIAATSLTEATGESEYRYDEPSGREPGGRFMAVPVNDGSPEFDPPDIDPDMDNDSSESDGADGGIAPDIVETLGGDEVEEVEEADAAERRRRHPMRHYKIQEVIKRRQIMLVQVAKEERGNKGAALTTYLSLAGRYCVLMPNTNRGGGVSRKITSLADRRRLKDILEELDIPEGMGVIVRTAGAERSKAEIKRDYEYLLRLWNEIRDLTLRSTAPALIYEEGNLIKRSIRDLYTRDLDEVLVEGEEGYRTAKAFMRTLMPSHAKRVQPYRDPQIGLFHRFQVESQIDAIHSPVAQLRSGGYLVINQTEALVAIDVNSGRSTRERNIEETALRTNLEAADEIARQLRLRDLAGLIVIDFIDMEEHRNQIAVERRLKEALKNDRARIQVGRISPFGLLEMSRQRLRPSLTETSTQPCPHCGGTGFIRSVESTALHVLRSIEEEGIRRRSAEICVYVPTTVALYILNQKRDSLNRIETRYTLHVMVARDDSLIPPAFRLERLRSYGIGEAPPVRPIQAPSFSEYDSGDEDDSGEAEAELETAADPEAAGENGDTEHDRPTDDERGRRRRRRRRRRGDETRDAHHAVSETGADDEQEGAEADSAGREEPIEAERDGDSEAERRRRRRGRRGGRLRPRRDDQRDDQGEEHRDDAAGADAVADAEVPAAETIEIVAAEAPSVAAEAETVALDPWPAQYGAEVETASLAPFAGEASGAEGGQPEPTAETTEDQTERGWEHEAPGDETGEPRIVPTAEAEQGVPFVSQSERELETAETAAEAVLSSGEPARSEADTGVEGEIAPQRAAEWETDSFASGVVTDPPPAIEPERGEFPPAPSISADPGTGEPAATETSPVEPAAAEPLYAEAAHSEHSEPAPSEPAAAPEARPAEDVLVVTEKPANPRRGWWQRGVTRP
ncbi:MAG: Rne/Rng family ribonuclease [Alphaproteobacteria bacterium]